MQKLNKRFPISPKPRELDPTSSATTFRRCRLACGKVLVTRVCVCVCVCVCSWQVTEGQRKACAVPGSVDALIVGCSPECATVEIISGGVLCHIRSPLIQALAALCVFGGRRKSSRS